jgi:thiol:disulfide interchange protein DsbD
LVLAGVVIGVKSAGELASWGMQMSNPQFVVLLTVLIMLVALNLFGLFEVTLGSVGAAAGSVATREGAGGAFFNGVLATVLATPCTAPFLAPALGFAFTQTAAVIVLMFVTVALGLAFPYVALSWNPKLLRFLPKPGLWMEKFKVAMGFPMLATGVWLFTVSIEYYGSRVLWFGIFLTVIAMAAWVFGEFFQRGTGRRGLALGIAVALTLGGVVFGLEGQMQWRTPTDPLAANAGVVQDFPGGIRWHRWSPEAVAKAREAGQPVLVDFTAKWCATCIWNKKTSIDIESVGAVMADKNFKAFRADYTRRPDYITEELRDRGRAGVPLVLVFPADKTREPEMLPELLTADTVLNALNGAVD